MPGESSQLLDTLAKSTCGSCGITCEPGTQDISLCAARDISEIHINAGDLVDRIEIRYRDGTSAIHGAKGGNKMKPFLFKPGEKLVRISVRQGDSLDGCSFIWIPEGARSGMEDVAEGVDRSKHRHIGRFSISCDQKQGSVPASPTLCSKLTVASVTPTNTEVDTSLNMMTPSSNGATTAVQDGGTNGSSRKTCRNHRQ